MSSVKTMSTWARLVTSYDEIPEPFKKRFETFFDGTTAFPYTIFSPPGRWGSRYVNPKLIFMQNGEIHILEKCKKEIRCVTFFLKDISYIEWGTVLLHSWMKIVGISDGTPATSIIEFNSVVSKLFEAMVEEIRLLTVKPACMDMGDILSKFDFLESRNFKLMNYSRQSVLRGEDISHIVFQPEIRVKVFRFLNKDFYKRVSCAHVSILTDRELIIIRDSANTVREVTNYGGVWTYIPLQKIADLKLEEDPEKGLLQLNVQFHDDESIKSMYEAAGEKDLELLFDALDKQPSACLMH